jgi:predicted NBD/HSP70 family sugar kinase
MAASRRSVAGAPLQGVVPGQVHTGVGPGGLLQLIRHGHARSRAELCTLTGLSRSTVTQRIEALLGHELIRHAGDGQSTGGRRPSHFEFNERAGVVLAADLGATHSRVAVTDLACHVLADHAEDLEIALGPDLVLDWLESALDRVLAAAGVEHGAVRAVGVGLPGPVEFAIGEPVRPPLMPGWDGYPVGRRLGERFGVPVLVDNDVNIMALGEHWMNWRQAEHLLFVKVGTGIGCGIVAGGRIHRGGKGAAGDIGHVRVEGYDDVLCHCGNAGCLEAVAGGRGLVRQLAASGLAVESSRDVIELVERQDARAVQAVRESGRLLGDVLATIVNFFNPEVIVVGGDVAHAHDQLLAGVRERVYRRSTPLALRHLDLAESRLDDRAGVLGAAVMVIEHVLSAEAVDAEVAGAAG